MNLTDYIDSILFHIVHIQGDDKVTRR